MKHILVGALMLAAGAVIAQNRAALESSKDPGIDFVKIAPGEFTMGCSSEDGDCNADEKPAHKVQLTKAFEIGKYEVTQAQWQAVMGSNPSTVKGDNRPVETITKTEALDFLSKLTARNDGYRYRLPTEAEWEYAARAGATGPLTGKLDDVAWYAGNSEDETHPVGKKKPNGWGLYDTLGNVREWVSDTYGRNYYGSSPSVDPTGPVGGQRGDGGGRGGFGRRGPRGGVGQPGLEQQAPQGGADGRGGRGGRGGPGGRGGRGGRGGPGGNQLPVIRGGGWDNPANFVRLSARYSYYGPTLRVSDVGLRVVREPVAREN